ncbi:MAG: PaeR7I family type II restriction endonuclease [Acutalibacteraceae bacterium]
MAMIKLPVDLDNRIASAVEFFWNTRTGQITKQNDIGVHDQGNRGAVTGGKQLDGFVDLIYDVLILNGVPEGCIYTNTDLELPGYYRPNKKWDLLVVDNGILVIAIEFKSQVGPSFGNNFNNRTEEAMGSALDIWTAYREGVFGKQRAPWLGYFMMLEDCSKSKEAVRVRSPHFPVLKEFIDASYMERYEIFCNKLLLERQYSSACFITSGVSDHDIFYNFPQQSLSCKEFLLSMLGAAMAHFFNR